jgi:predicted nucleic acid-binding protein
MPNAAFWDTSVLVPLCVPQGYTQIAGRLSKSYDAVVWWATPVELAGVLARLLRTAKIGRSELADARVLANGLDAWWSVIRPSDVLRARAQRIVESYGLRAADALQLSAGLEWCREDPRDRVFLTADKKLRDAALLSGFDAPQV